MSAPEAIRLAREMVERLKSDGAMARDLALTLFDDAFALLGNAAAQASLLRNVHPSAEARQAAERDEQEVDAAQTELSLDRGLYQALSRVDVADADPVTRWLVEKGLRDFRRAGVDRDDVTRARLQALREELVRIGQEFGRNVRDDAKEIFVDPSELAGLPEEIGRAHV